MLIEILQNAQFDWSAEHRSARTIEVSQQCSALQLIWDFFKVSSSQNQGRDASITSLPTKTSLIEVPTMVLVIVAMRGATRCPKATADGNVVQRGAGLVLFMEVNIHFPLIFSQVAFTWMTLLTTMGDVVRSIATHCVVIVALSP
jgi:hypothetical protein